MSMDRYSLKTECGGCRKVVEMSVEENDGWRFQNRGAERRAIQVSEGFVVVHDGKAVQCECGERISV